MTALRVRPLADGSLLIGTSVRQFRLNPPAGTNVNADGSKDLYVARFDGDGAKQWERLFGGFYDETLRSIAATPDGGAIVASNTRSLGERNDRTEAWLLRLGPDGAVIANCVGELLQSLYTPAVLHSSHGLTGTPSTSQEIGQISPSSLPASAPAGVSVTPLSSPVTVTRQCAGNAQVAGSPLPPAPSFQLRVVQGGSITGVVTSIPAGISCGVGAGGNVCETRFAPNLLATLDVDFGSRGTFESWQGCDTMDGTRCLVRMTSDRTITATFATEPRPPIVGMLLTVTGRGRVISTAGIDCGFNAAGRCSASTTRNSDITLTATPATNRTFIGWAGLRLARDQPHRHREDGREQELRGAIHGRAVGWRLSSRSTPRRRYSSALDGQTEFAFVGNVTSTPTGINCGTRASLCSEAFERGTDVVLTAEATHPDYQFEEFVCPGVVIPRGQRTLTIPAIRRNITCQARFSTAIERFYLRHRRGSGAVLSGSRRQGSRGIRVHGRLRFSARA